MSVTGEVLIVIPARGGSKRLLHKNMLPLAGKPLICWTIEAALGAQLDARIMVSSDDDEILSVARLYEDRGVNSYKRSDDLATDVASTADVLADAVRAEQLTGRKPETVVLLQPTSPLRSSLDIRTAIEVYRKGGTYDTVVTVCEVDHPTAWVGTMGSDSQLEGVDLSIGRSQDHLKEYRLNGAVYVIRSDWLMSSGSIFTPRLLASVMPRDRSLDIDERIDFNVCEMMMGCRVDN